MCCFSVSCPPMGEGCHAVTGRGLSKDTQLPGLLFITPQQAAKNLQIGPLTLGPFPPEKGKGRCAVSQFPAPLWGKDVTQ